MEKLEELKLFLLEHKKKFMVGGMVTVTVIGLSISFIITGYQKKERVIEEEWFDTRKNQDEIVNPVEKKEEMEISKEETTENQNINKPCNVWVDIKGEVIRPGLYEMRCEDRVADAINKAGGQTNNGDTSNINLGKKLFDEMVIIVDSKKIPTTNATSDNKNSITQGENTNQVENSQKNSSEETNIKLGEDVKGDLIKNDASITENDKNGNSTKDTSKEEAIDDDGYIPSISLNKATIEELMKLPGIGESKAQLMIEYRNNNGGFKSIEEITNVKGIGTKIFEKIKQYLTL